MSENIKLGIVVSEFNSDITGKMLKQALKRSADLKSLTTYVCKVPGSYDMPLMIQSLLEKDDVDAVVMLGAIIKGETKHDELIADKLACVAVLHLLYHHWIARPAPFLLCNFPFTFYHLDRRIHAPVGVLFSPCYRLLPCHRGP